MTMIPQFDIKKHLELSDLGHNDKFIVPIVLEAKVL